MSASSLTLELSWPERPLWPNARPDSHARTDVARQGRHEGYVVTLEALAGDTFTADALEIPVRLVARQPNRHRRDKDGFLSACKSRLDGIAQALQLDDSRFNPRVEWGPFETPRGGVTVIVG